MFSFNAEEEKEFDNTLAEAEYEVMITDAEYAPANSNPNNHVLSLTLAITDPSSPYDGWKIYDRYNVQNLNEMAQKIARSDLKKLCMAIGMASFQNPQELVGHSLIIETRNREYQGKTFPNVTERKAREHMQPPVPQQQFQQPVQAQQYQQPVPHQEQPQRQQPVQAQQQFQQPVHAQQPMQQQQPQAQQPNLDTIPF